MYFFYSLIHICPRKEREAEGGKGRQRGRGSFFSETTLMKFIPYFLLVFLREIIHADNLLDALYKGYYDVTLLYCASRR